MFNIRAHPQCAPRYDFPALLEIDAGLDLDLLTEAIGDVVQRHAALRTTIDTTSGTDLQWVHDEAPAAVVRQQLPDGALSELVAALMRQRFGVADVTAGRPLFRAGIHEAGQRVYLSIAIHHLVNDGWSDDILWRDLSECYTARSQQRTPSLPPLTMSYAQFAVWQRETWQDLRDEVVPKWQDRLAGYPAGRLPWPPSHHGIDAASLENDACPVAIDEDMLAAVRRTSRAGKVTPFVVLLAVSAVAFSRVLDRDDVLLGSTTANREAPFKHELIGHFANTRLTRVRVDPAEPFGALVAQVRESWLTNNEHCEVYSNSLLQELGHPGWAHVNLNPAAGVAPRPAVMPKLARRLVAIDDTAKLLDWRDVGLMWTPVGQGFTADFLHRLSRVDPATASAVCLEIESVLRTL